MIQDTTIRSYEQNIRPKLPHLQFEIRQLLRTYPDGLTNKEIAKLLGKDASTISGIVRPMVKQNKVFEVCERMCSVTGNRAKVWQLVGYKPPAPKVAETVNQLSLLA